MAAAIAQSLGYARVGELLLRSHKQIVQAFGLLLAGAAWATLDEFANSLISRPLHSTSDRAV